jgi:hypothetical protein
MRNRLDWPETLGVQVHLADVLSDNQLLSFRPT